MRLANYDRRCSLPELSWQEQLRETDNGQFSRLESINETVDYIHKKGRGR